MADLIFSHNVEDWVKLQLSLYVTHPEYDEFAIGETVLEEKTTTTPTLVSDGTGANVLGMSDSALSDLIDNSKPSGYNNSTHELPAGSPIYKYTNQKWKSIIKAAKDDRENYLSSTSSDPLDPWE